MWVAHGYFAYVNEISFAYPEHLVHEGIAGRALLVLYMTTACHTIGEQEPGHATAPATAYKQICLHCPKFGVRIMD